MRKRSEDDKINTIIPKEAIASILQNKFKLLKA